MNDDENLWRNAMLLLAAKIVLAGVLGVLFGCGLIALMRMLGE